MKRTALSILMAVGALSSTANAQEIFLHKLSEKFNEEVVEEAKQMKNDFKENAYIAVSLHFPIVPSDLSAAIGYEFNEGLAQAELYVSLRVARFFSDEHDLHIPVGARVRFALNGSRTLYIEYQREFTVINNNEYGLLETPNLVSIVKKFDDAGILLGCGIGNMKHHAWRDEDHDVEESGYFECKIEKQF